MGKYFFFDVDGTLLPFGKSMPDSAVYAIKAAQALESRCFIATGRSKAELPRFERLEFDGYICSAGATIEIDGERIYSAHIERPLFNDLFNYLSKRGFYVLTQTDSATYLTQEAGDMFKRQLMIHIGRVVELNGLVISSSVPENEDVKKLLILSSRDSLSVRSVIKDLDPSFTLVNNTVGLPEDLMAEIVLSDISKATGIEKVLSYYGASREDSVAIGDGSNDIEMVEYANIGIAMGNASADLIAVADYVTTDIEKDGIKNAIFYALQGGNNGRGEEEGRVQEFAKK